MAKQGEGSRPAPLAHDAASQAPRSRRVGRGRGRWGHLLACHASPGPVMQTKTRAGFFVAPRCEASQNLSMLKIRIIPCLDVKDGRVVKGINFVDLKDAGDPVAAAAAYDAAGGGRVVLSRYCRQPRTPRHDLRDRRAHGPRAASCLSRSGAACAAVPTFANCCGPAPTRFPINTAAVNRRELVAEAADKFGAQCIVVAIDARRVAHPPQAPRWEIFTHGGRNPTGLDAVAYAREVVALGAGEILLTSMDRDGTQAGFDLELTRAVADAVPVPVIASGGVGRLDHLVAGVRLGHASAVLAASIFHYGTFTIAEAKRHMAAAGLPMRLDATA